MNDLSQQQRDVLNYLLYAPRVRPDPDLRDAFTIWWFGGRPFLPEFMTGSGSLSALPAGLTPEVIDSLAAAGLLDVKKSAAAVWDITIRPPARAVVLPFSSRFIDGETSATYPSLTIGEEPAAPDVPATSPGPRDPDAQAHRVRLARLINDTFDDDELRTLCFDLGVNYGNLRGERMESRARDLVTRMEKDGRLAELQRYLAEKRPAHYSAYMDPGT